MKNYFLFVFFLLICSGASSQSVHAISFRNVDGDTIRLSNYNGKKILFTLLAMSQQDSVFQQVKDFKSRYGDTIVVIGILSIEDGYSQSNATAIKSMYAGTGIILSEGMYSRKVSGSSQSVLMQWLTDKTKNQHYDMDASGVGHKFFVSGTGKLFASLSKQSSFQSPIINRIVHSNNGQGQ
jgi:glutathione peroxidase-family protein